MRKIIFTLLSVLLVSCSVDSDLETQATSNPKWSLVESVGGVAGTTANYEVNQINWTFNDLDGTLLVEHNVEGISDALDPGTYDFNLQAINNASFIFINDVEFGAITINVNRFVIDQNITSDGSTVSDKFEYSFTR